MLTAVNGKEAGVVAFLSKAETPDSLLWMLIGDGKRMRDADVAFLLALLALDDAVQLMPPQFMPRGAPMAVLLEDRTLRHSRRRTFPPWALRAAARSRDQLLAVELPYIRAVRDVLSSHEARGFTRVPPDFILRDPEGISRISSRLPDISVDVSEEPSARHGARWDQIARVDYARDRYLAHLSREAIAQRMMDCINNLHVIDPHGLVSYDTNDAEAFYWLQRMCEVMSEMQLRYGSYPAGYDDLLTGVEWVGSLRSSEWRFQGPLIPPSSLAAPFLVKYGERQFLEPMLEYGRMRVSPASRYNDPSLNSAIRDDELTAELDVDDFGVPAFGGRPGFIAASSRQRNRVRMRFPTNYYVYCTSRRFVTRLAHDFNADCCVVLRDPAEFEARLLKAMLERLPGWQSRKAHVEYYDPMWVNVLEVDVLTWKHFRYAYQEEERLAWLPPQPVEELAPIDLELGSLADLATLVVP